MWNLNHPTKSDVDTARDRLMTVVTDFPFAAPVHCAAWLAALLTPLARFAFQGPAPLFLVDANATGTGKGLLVDSISEIVMGCRMSVCPNNPDQAELRKRITALAIEGAELALIDNIDGSLGGSTLDAARTASVWSDRLQGPTPPSRSH